MRAGRFTANAMRAGRGASYDMIGRRTTQTERLESEEDQDYISNPN